MIYEIKSWVDRETNRLIGILSSKIQNDIIKCDEIKGSVGGVKSKAQNVCDQKWTSILCESTLHAQTNDGSKTHGWGE